MAGITSERSNSKLSIVNLGQAIDQQTLEDEGVVTQAIYSYNAKSRPSQETSLELNEMMNGRSSLARSSLDGAPIYSKKEESNRKNEPVRLAGSILKPVKLKSKDQFNFVKGSKSLIQQ